MNERIKELQSEELALFNQTQTLLQEQLSEDEDIPLGVSLINTPAGLAQREFVLVARNGKTVLERWLFLTPPSPEDLSFALPNPDLECIKKTSVKLGIMKEDVLNAAALTKTLAENPTKDPVSLSLYDGPEAIRLVEAMLPGSKEGGLTILPSRGYELQYYTCYGEIGGEPLRNLFVHTNHKKASFRELFPAVLLFTSHVANKRQLQVEEIRKMAETEKLQQTL